MSARPTNPAEVTAYAVVVEGAAKRLDIVYWWFFNYNQGKTVAGTSWGNHVSDWEHVKVKLDQVDFAKPQNEVVVGVMYDHHGTQDNFKPGDGNTEFSGRQVLVHLANGDHEAYAKAGVYDRPQGTHDYCKDNAYRFDQRAGVVEIYLWNGSDFSPTPPGATPNFKDPGVAQISRALEQPATRRFARAGGEAGVGARGHLPAERISAAASLGLGSVQRPIQRLEQDAIRSNQHRHCERSEAIQGNVGRPRLLDRRVPPGSKARGSSR